MKQTSARDKIIYWISTALLCGLMGFSAGMYFTKTEMVQGFFEHLAYPTYLIYPLAIAKILGIIAILSQYSKMLKEWAYAGFFFDLILALTAHAVVGDAVGMSAAGLIFLATSYIMDRRIHGNASGGPLVNQS